MTDHKNPTTASKTDPEYTGSGWKHPYVLYLVLTTVLFLFLIFMGWLAVTMDWIPKR